MTNMLMIHMVPQIYPEYLPNDQQRRPNHEIYYRQRTTPKENFVIDEDNEPFIRIIMIKPNQDS